MLVAIVFYPIHEIGLGSTVGNTTPQAGEMVPTTGGMKWVWLVSTRTPGNWMVSAGVLKEMPENATTRHPNVIRMAAMLCFRVIWMVLRAEDRPTGVILAMGCIPTPRIWRW